MRRNELSVSEVDGGEWELSPGDIVSLPSSAHTSWVVDEAFRELWVYSAG